MSVNVVTGLADAYTALTGLETVQTATGIMVNNSGSWISASDSTIYNVIKNGGCKAVGQVTHISPNAWNVVGYEPKIGQFLYEGSNALKVDYMWSVPEQYAGNALARTQTISNAGRAALQNNGAQIGNKVLQPITKMEIIQSTGGTTLKTTSKGVLTKVPLKAVMRACAVAQGVIMGIDIVETNPEICTKISNRIFNTNYDPADIANIVENTTVWANIKDGAVFIAEDIINAIRSVFLEEGVYNSSTDSGLSIGGEEGTGSQFVTIKISPSSTETWYMKGIGSLINITPTVSGQRFVIVSNRNANRSGSFNVSLHAGVNLFSNHPFSVTKMDGNSIQNGSYPPDPTYSSAVTVNSSSTDYGVYSTGFIGATSSFRSGVYTPAPSVEKQLTYNLPVVEAVLDCTNATSSISNSAIVARDYFNGDMSHVITPVAPVLEGIQKIPGAVYPTTGGSTATDYPDWWNNRSETLEGNNDTGEIVPVPWLPVNIFQPTGDDPNEYSQQDSQNGDVNDYDKIAVIIDTFDDALEDNEQDPDPDPDPYPYPNPNPTPDPTLVTPITPIPPVEDPSDGVSPDPTNPIITTAATSGLAHIYNPTLSEVQALSRKLWTLDFLENLKKIFVDPMDGIIGFLIIYATPKTTNPEDIVLGVYNTNVPAKVVTNQYITIDCGSVTVNEFFNDARDYAPYTTVSLYLPFIGVVSLYADDIINSHVNIIYHIDVLTGTCLATVKVIKQGASAVIYQYPGNCAVQIPLTSMNYSSIVTSLFSVGISAVGGAALGTAKAVGRRAAGALYGAARSAAINASTSQIEVQQSGSIGSNAGVMGIRTPYFIIRRPVINDAYGYPQQYGYPANKWVVLGTMKGFTRIKAIHLDSIVCTDEEKEMIDSLLKEGVVF